MKARTLSSLVFITAGAAALGFGLPALGQQGPESILPPGFGDPPPPPPPPTSNPNGNTSSGTESGPKSSNSSASPAKKKSSSQGSSSSSSSKSSGDDDLLEEEEELVRYDVPPSARRSLSNIGLVSAKNGGFVSNAYGAANGVFLKNVLSNTKGPLASRWATIMTRRLLTSRTDTPNAVNGADWAAERANLLLRMGDAVSARLLVQQVDSDRYSTRLLEVALPVFLANGDLAGMCPVAELGRSKTEIAGWKAAPAICASLAGEQGQASALLNQIQNRKIMSGTDFLLAEKAVGAGTDGRRNVKIEWEKVTSFSEWRHGLSVATGMEPPERLYKDMGRHMPGWRALLPMASTQTKLATAPDAAALGVLSNRAMVDLYAQAAEDQSAGEDISEITEQLRTAYVGSDISGRIAAMESLWSSAKTPSQKQGMMVLTARAATLIPASSGLSGSADALIQSMMTAGFDNQATNWANFVKQGSLGWGLLATGAPEWEGKLDYSALDDFKDEDSSSNYHKSSLFVAGALGLERTTREAAQEFISDTDINILKTTKWSEAIGAAADRGEQGTVVLLAASGLQVSSWEKVPAHHLYHIVDALRRVGLEAEARMIATEAVSFG